MDDILQTNAEETRLPIELGKLLDEHNGQEVVIMDMRTLNFWTDFFIITTVTSNAHLMGLERHIKDFLRENELEILHRSKRPEKGSDQRYDEWSLLDLGGMVIHLMSAKTRSFFELERLWSAAPVIFRTSSPQTYSSKSS